MKKIRRRWWLVALVVVIAAAGGVTAWLLLSRDSTATVRYLTSTAQTGTIESTVQADFTLVAARSSATITLGQTSELQRQLRQQQLERQHVQCRDLQQKRGLRQLIPADPDPYADPDAHADAEADAHPDPHADSDSDPYARPRLRPQRRRSARRMPRPAPRASCSRRSRPPAPARPAPRPLA